jgi:hypothetical protein
LKLHLRKTNGGGTGSAAGGSNSVNTNTSAKTSPSGVNVIQTKHQIYYNQHKIPPLSTDHQAKLHKFEFPHSKGNSGHSEDLEIDSNNVYNIKRMATESVTLSQNFSPH